MKLLQFALLCAWAIAADAIHAIERPKVDPWQTNNVASVPRYAKALAALHDELDRHLVSTKDPRARGEGDRFDRYVYVTGGGGNRLKAEVKPKSE